MYRFFVAIVFGCIMSLSSILARPSENVVKKPEFVMILNTYSYGQEWSTALAKEIRNRLEAGKPDIKVNTTYASIAARTSFLADRFAMQGAFANGRLNNQIKIPDVLVLIGDESWMLYRVMNHRGIWEKIPVVLCGVHAEILKDYELFFPDKQLPDSSFIPLEASTANLSVTAVIEPDNTARTLQLARTLVPGLQTVCYLSDGSYADKYMQKKLEENCGHAGVSLYEIQFEHSNEDSVVQVLTELPAGTAVVTNGAAVPDGIKAPVLVLRDVSYRSHTPAGGYFAPVASYADKTAEAVLHILEAGAADSVPYVVASDTAFHLNQTALMHAGLRSAVKSLPDVVERNVPPPFVIRHIRVITILLLVVIVSVFVVVRQVNSRRYRRELNALFERYKTLYDEYQVVYENMPVGLMLFDIYGNLLKRNAETDVFFELFAHSRADLFHLFSADILDDDMRQALFNKKLVSKMLHMGGYCYRVQCCMIADEETGANHILVIVIDNTDIEKEKKAKEQICHVLNFAMNEAKIGVAEYNLMDGLGFATDAWYDAVDVERGTADFSQSHQCLVPDDRKKIESYLEHVRCGAAYNFLGSLQMRGRNGETHYIRYLIQPLEYVPDKKRVVIAELVLHMDEQIAKELELKAEMKKAQEADRLKNAFVANMKDEIRVPLKEIIACAKELVETSGQKRKDELNVRIEAANNRILKLLADIIAVSKMESNK